MAPSMSLASFAGALLVSSTLALHDHNLPHQQRRVVNGTVPASPPASLPAKVDIAEVDNANLDVSESEFTVHQIKNPHYKPKSGLQAMLEAYTKFSAPLTPDLRMALKINQDALTKRQVTGTTSAIPPQGYDYEYVCPVNIGTPPQSLYLNFDTGSSDLWVFSTDTNKSDVQGQGLYNVSSSSSAVLLANYTFSIGYGDGNTASGIVYTDTVSVGNASVAGMTVESATTVSTGFSKDPYAWGLFGLGMSSGNTVRPVRAKTFVDSIKSSLAAPLFTANLMHSVAGQYDFGYIDTSQYSGRIQFVGVDPSSIYWQTAATGYRIGAQPNASDPSSGYTTFAWRTIVDTGTTLLLLPDGIVTKYYASVPGAAYDSGWAGILFPCSADLPDFTFGIGLYKGVVPGRYINYGAVNSTTCYGGIQSQGSLAYGIFGDILLKAQYVVFDLGNQRIGFANKNLAT